ncbi:MAG: J domain-containing protein [Candidatus Nanoarchaeia archaeon]|nr:J domain-containing protein [Candidatus Nanoarchaeia archaeon]
MVKIKDQDFREIIIKDSYNRRALQFKNDIIKYLKNFGLTEDDVEIPLESNAMRKVQASASWYMLEHHLFFSYNGAAKFVENMAMVKQVIIYFLEQLMNDEISEEEFLEKFREDHDIIEQRKNARKVLGVHEDSLDFDEIHKNYKKLSKKHHPDMPEGDTEEFKRINVAHKILKKELNL